MAIDKFSDYPVTGGDGSQEYTSPQDESINFTAKNTRDDYVPQQPDVGYGVGATGSVSSSGRTNSGGGLGAPFIHPFKIQKFINPVDNSIKVRIYEGDVYAKIDTFQLGMITVTTSVESYHATNQTSSSSGPFTNEKSLVEHTHSAGTLKMKDHEHSDDRIAEYDTTGTPDTDSGQVNYPSGYSSGDNPNLEIEGNTGGVNTSGSSSSANAHKHTVPALESTTETKKFVVVTGQAEAPALTEANFAATFNKPVKFDDGTDTVFMYHESPHATGDFYVKWVITINEAAVVQTIVGSIERVDVGVGAPADVPFGALTQNNVTKALERAVLTGTFHQKIGSVSTTTVDQIQFSNINWSMTVLPEVS